MLKRYFAWLRANLFPMPRTMLELDQSAAEFVNSLWQEGDPHGYAGDLISGLSRFVPAARLHLSTTRLFFRNWTRTLTRVRAIPASAKIVRAFAGVALGMRRIDLMALFLAGFFGVLRTAEIFSLTAGQLVFGPGCRSVLLRLPQTKTTGRRNAPEHVLIQDPCVAAALKLASHGLHEQERIHRTRPENFGKELKLVALRLGFVSDKLTPYTFRRGGATWWFKATGSIDAVAARGRWSQVRTARLYVDSALVDECTWALSKIGEDLANFATSVLSEKLSATSRGLQCA